MHMKEVDVLNYLVEKYHIEDTSGNNHKISQSKEICENESVMDDTKEEIMDNVK